MATPKKTTKTKAEPGATTESKPCLADWQWWQLTGPCSSPASRGNLCREHSMKGPGWQREWAVGESGVRFSYIATDSISPPRLNDGEWARPEYMPTTYHPPAVAVEPEADEGYAF